MKIHQVKNIAASVQSRLHKMARETDRPFQELLQYYAMERFLYRLSQSPHADKFVLKGALMLVVWEAPQSRPTMDIDLLGEVNNDVNTVVDKIREICLQEVEQDGIVFDTSDIRGERIKEDADYEGVRVKFMAFLNRARITMQIDIGFGDIIVPAATSMEYPAILDFPKPKLRGYTRESVVSEKFEAMVKLGILNSRMKDFYDIYLLCRQFNFNGRKLAEAINKTFKNRGTELTDVPTAFTDEFIDNSEKNKQWRAFVKKNRIVDFPADLKDVIMSITEFLKPVIQALMKGIPFDLYWDFSGKWE